MSYRIDAYDKSIVIEGFEKGIADSPFDGISNLRNVNIISVPGEASVNFKVANTNTAPSGSVTSADTGTEILTYTPGVGALQDGSVIVFSAVTVGGLSTNTKYMVRSISGTTFKLYVSYATFVSDTPINLTSTGTGTFTSTIMGIPTQRWFDKTTGGYYFIDGNGRVWSVVGGTPRYLLGVDATTTTNANGNGIAVYQGYLFAFRNALIDYMVISTGVWTYGWQTMNTGASTNNPHYTHYGQDNTIYYTDANYVGSLRAIVGTTFNPAGSNGTDYVWTQDALTLPTNDTANCLAELGVNLLVGGQLNAIYPWNRSATDFSYPILLAENFITRMVTVNTNTYILAGQRGRIYYTNGSQASLFKKVPDHISGTIEPYFKWGDLASQRNQLYFGIQCKNSSTDTVISEYGGVWAIDLDSQAIRLTNKLSFGTYSGIATAILPITRTPSGNPPFPDITSGVGLYIGWDSGASTYGIDASAQVPYSTSEATIDSDLIPIGTYEKPRDNTRIEYKLSNPFANGESITLQYRLDFSQSYTTIFTDTATSTYLPFSGTSAVNWKNAQWLQIRAILNSTDTTPSYVRLKEIRIVGLVE